MTKNRYLSFLLVLAMAVTGLLPAAGVAAPPSAVLAPDSPMQVNVAGNFEEALGGANWSNNDPLTDMADANGDGVWKFAANVPTAGDYEYKVVEDANWDLAYPASNVPFSVAGDGDQVRWYYDENDHYVADSASQVIAAVAGNFAAAIGGQDWAPDHLLTWMKDGDGDGVYEYTAQGVPEGDYEYKVALDEGWDEAYPPSNRAFSVPAGGSDVTFTFDSVTKAVNETVGGGGEELLVTFPGDYPAAAGLGANWDPGDLNTQAQDDNSDGVWKFVTDAIPAGDYAFKAAVGGSWDENYGAGGQPGGDNVTFTTPGGETVHFYYDRSDNFVASRPDHRIPVLVGDLMSEVGGADWAPDNLVGWMKDRTGDGVYEIVLALPEGEWAYKVALNESWDENYGAGGEPNGPNLTLSVPAGGAEYRFSYDDATHAIEAERTDVMFTLHLPLVALNPSAALVRESVQHPIQDSIFYFVLPDRFYNGDMANDEGDQPGGSLAETGFLADDKAFYHGGDLPGLLSQLDYLAGLGVNAIWMTPIFKNQATQPDSSTAFGIGAGYHGYWILDYEMADPHLGADQDLQDFIAAAHERDIKVFFDIVVNHTADVIDYAEGESAYRSKADYPYRDAEGDEFDDRDYVGGDAFPALDPAVSFPYTPIFPDPGDETAKNPAWLNDPIYYHNRGDSTFVGENSLYGDFFGLDDLFTEHPAVVDGYIDLFKGWIQDYDVDGYRLDTAKHVNIEFWQQFAPEIMAFAQAEGKADFFMFGEVFDGNPAFMSRYTSEGQLPGVLDFGLHGQANSFAVQSNATDSLRDFFANDDYFTDADSNAYSLANFISNHDLGRLGRALQTSLPGAGDAEWVARSQLGHALIYFARGFPVVYYGDEQGFTGDGGDKDAREDMMPSLVASYNDNDLIGTDATTAEANFDADHPIYQALAEYGALYQEHLALRRGAQIHRYSSDSAGIYAFSRIERQEQVEYVLAFNNAATAQQAAFPTYLADSEFSAVYPAGNPALTTNAAGEITVAVPALSFVIYKARAPLPASTAAPTPTFTVPVAGSEVSGRTEAAVALDAAAFVEVTFAVQIGDGSFTVIGVDNNPPYRVFYDVSSLPIGAGLTFKAIVNDLSGHLSSTTTTAIVGEEAQPEAGYAIIHYKRPAGDYGDHTTGDFNDFWGLHLWGDAIDPSEATDWPNPKPFLGEDDFGRFAYIKLANVASPVNFIIHKGDVKDTPDDRSFDPAQNPEIWVNQDDATHYASQADAQGYVTVHYLREDGDYGDYESDDYNDFWGLHLWTAQGDLTPWTGPKKADGQDDYGVFFTIALADYPAALDFSLPLNFILHRGDVKDPADSPDRSFEPAETAAIWLRQDDLAVYDQRGGAEDFALLHYRRPAGDYGDYDSADYNDFWGLHVWQDTTDSPGWTTPLKPIAQDVFGVVFRVNLTENAQQIGYIFHRGDEKDPGPDQFLAFDTYGYEVWQLQGADPEAPYVYPILFGGAGPNPGDIGQQQAYWVAENTIAWAAADDASLSYTLHYAAEGGLEATATGIEGGDSLALARDPAGLSDEIKAKFPHLADLPALKIDDDDLSLVADILKGQIAVSAVDGDGASVDATGLQIPGVLDDLYTYGGELGVAWEDDTPVLRLWAPTARSVTLHRFADSDPDTVAVTHEMAYDPASGAWMVTGEPGWKGQYYLYEVEVFVHSTGQVEHNLVTDPYSFSLALNSTRSQVVNLADDELKPAGWETLQKPALAAPEDVSLYELHIRDFSVNDLTVPEAHRGTYKAFTDVDANGMQHLQALAGAGLSHVHLLPAFDIATINENKAEWQAPDPDELAAYPPNSEQQQTAAGMFRNLDGFNWGYDPLHYTVPEGSYSTDPDGNTRIVEFREMVQALNESGLRVVMDVVYNHTNASGQNPNSVLDRIVPGYYHRLNNRGAVETSTCCANTASEHNMMEKLMIDSLVTWARHYKVDGFRFDLMGHHMVFNMVNVRQALDALTLEEDGVDGQAIYVYGEGWNFGEVADSARGVNATQLNLPGNGIGLFNDRLRDAVRGAGPFDRGEGMKKQGFANGLFYDPNASDQGAPAEQLASLLLRSDQIRVGLAGNLAGYQFIDRNGDLVTGADVDYNGSPAGYTLDPQEEITYVAAHDNQTLFDINVYGAPVDTNMADRVRIQQMGLSIVALGQGVPFLHAGSDILRSKSLDRNSYDSGDWFNKLDFTYQDNNFGVGLPPAWDNQEDWGVMSPLLANPDLKPATQNILFSASLTQEWFQIRRSSRLFRLETAADIQQRVAFHNTGPNQTPGLIVMTLSDAPDPDLDAEREIIAVLFNANDETQTFTASALAGSQLVLHPVQQASVDDVVKTATFDGETGAFTVPARTTAVFVDAQPTAVKLTGVQAGSAAAPAAGVGLLPVLSAILAAIGAALFTARRRED